MIKLKRNKSLTDFDLAKRNTMEKLRSRSSCNGVLENLNIKPNIGNQHQQKQSQLCKAVNLRRREKIPKLPSIVKTLKIDQMNKIKKYIPAEGHIDIEISNQQKNSLLNSTISKEGAIFAIRHCIEFLSVSELGVRQHILEKLSCIPTVKHLNVLKIFLKWKMYTKRKRYSMTIQCLSNKIKPDLLVQRWNVIDRMQTYLNQSQYAYFYNILQHSGFFLATPKKILKQVVNIHKELIKCFMSSFQILQKERETSIQGFLIEFRTLIRVCFYCYQKIDLEFREEIFQSLCKEIQGKYKQFAQSRQSLLPRIKEGKMTTGSKSTFFIVTEMEYSTTAGGYVLSKHGENQESTLDPWGLFANFLSFERSQKQFKQQLDDYRNVNKEACKAIEEVFREVCDGQRCAIEKQQKQSSAYQTIKRIIFLNLKDLTQFVEDFGDLLKQFEIEMKQLHPAYLVECEQNENNSDALAKEIFLMKQKKSKIETLPEKIQIGLFEVSIEKIKMRLQQSFDASWESLVNELPMNLKKKFQKLCSEYQEMEEKISFSMWSLEELVVAHRQNSRFQDWKVNNTKVIEEIESLIEILSKINPRKSEAFLLKSIQLKQNIKYLTQKSKSFEATFSNRLKYYSSQKLALKEKLDHELEQLNKKVVEIRKTTKHEHFAFKDKIEALKKDCSNFERNIGLLHSYCIIEEACTMSGELVRSSTSSDCLVTKLQEQFHKLSKELNLYYEIENRLKLSNDCLSEKIVNSKSLVSEFSCDPELLADINSNLTEINRVIEDQEIFVYSPLLQTIKSDYEKSKKFVNTIRIFQRFSHLNNDVKLALKKTVNSLWEEQYHIKHESLINEIIEQERMIKLFKKAQKNYENKIKEFKILPASESFDREFLLLPSIDEAIQIFNNFIKALEVKLKHINENYSEQWKIYYCDDILQTIERVKTFNRAVELLVRVNELKKSFNKNRDIKRNIFGEIEEKIIPKWNLIFNRFKNTTLVEYLKKTKAFTKIVEEIEELQFETDEKIEYLFHKHCSLFPVFYLYDKSVIFQSIFDPLFFVGFFFNNCEVKQQSDSVLTIQTANHEKLKLEASKASSVRQIFGKIEKQIKCLLIEKMNFYDQEYCYLDWFDPKHEGTILQVVSFIDLNKIQGYSASYEGREILQREINKITNTISDSFKIEDGVNKYKIAVWKLLIMNRIELRDVSMMPEEIANWYPRYEHDENEDEFVLRVLSVPTKLSCHFVGSENNSLLATPKVLYSFALFHESFGNSQRLIVQNTQILDCYCFRVMKYHFKYPLFSSKFRSILFAINRANIIVTFENKKPLTLNQVEKLYKEIEAVDLKIKQRGLFRGEWPIVFHITLEEELRLELKSYFRQINFAGFQMSSVIELAIREEINSFFVNSVIRFTISEGNTRNGKFQSFKKNMKLFCQTYTTLNKVHLREQEIVKIVKYLCFKIQSLNLSRKYSNAKNTEVYKQELVTLLMGINNKSHPLYAKITNDFDLRKLETQKETVTQSKIKSVVFTTDKIIEDENPDESRNQYNLSVELSLTNTKLSKLLKSQKMVMVLGEPGAGKSYFIRNYFTYHHSSNFIQLHSSALGKKIWNSDSTFFNNKSLSENEYYFIFQGDLREQNYPHFRAMLQTQSLFYSTGEKVKMSPLSRIVFEVENSCHMNPLILTTLKHIYINQADEITWDIVCTKKYKLWIKTLLEFINRDIPTSKLKLLETLEEDFFKNFSNFVKDFLTNVLFHFTKNGLAYYYSLMNEKIMVVQIFHVLFCYLDELATFIIESAREENLFTKLQKTMQDLVSFCVYTAFKQSIDSNSQTKLKLMMKEICRNYEYIQIDNFDDKIPVFNLSEYSNEPAAFPITVLDCPSSIFVPTKNNQMLVALAQRLINCNSNIALRGGESVGKTTVIKMILFEKQTKQTSFRFPNSYEKLLNLINHKSAAIDLSTYEFKPFIIFVDDCSFEKQHQKDVLNNLKYIWETNQIFDDHALLLKETCELRFVFQTSCSQQRKEFIHAFPFEVSSEQNYAESVYSHIISSLLVQNREVNLTDASQDKACAIRLLMIVENCKRAFQPSKIEDWKHYYGHWIVTEGLKVYTRRQKSKRSTMKVIGENEDVYQQEIRSTELLTNIIRSMISFRLTKQEAHVFNKIFTKTKSVELDLLESRKHLENKILQLFQRCGSKIEEIIITPTLINNVSKIHEAIQFTDCLFVSSVAWNGIGNIAEFAFTLLENTCVVHIDKVFNSYQQFKLSLTNLTPNHEYAGGNIINSSQSKNDFDYREIFYFNEDIVRMNSQNIILYLLEYFNQTQFSHKFSLKKTIVLSFNPQDSTIISQIVSNKQILQKCLTVVFDVEDLEVIVKEIIKQRENQISDVEGYSELPNKLYKVYKVFREKVESLDSPSANDLTRRKIDCYAKMENSSLLNSSGIEISSKKINLKVFHRILNEKNFVNFLKIFISYYRSEIRNIEWNRKNIHSGVSEIDKIMNSYHQKQDKLTSLKTEQNKMLQELKSTEKRLEKLKEKTVEFMKEGFDKQLDDMKKESDKNSKEIKNVSKVKRNILKAFRESLAAINRTQISELKYIFSNNKDFHSDLFECIRLVICEDSDTNVISKLIMDTHFIFKVKEAKFGSRSSEVLQEIKEKMQNLIENCEQKQILKSIIDWLYYGSSYELFLRNEQAMYEELNTKKEELEGKIEKFEETHNMKETEEKIEVEKKKITEIMEAIDRVSSKISSLEKALASIESITLFEGFKQFSLKWDENLNNKQKSTAASCIFSCFSFIFLCYFKGPELVTLKSILKNVINQLFDNSFAENTNFKTWIHLYYLEKQQQKTANRPHKQHIQRMEENLIKELVRLSKLSVGSHQQTCCQYEQINAKIAEINSNKMMKIFAFFFNLHKIEFEQKKEENYLRDVGRQEQRGKFQSKTSSQNLLIINKLGLFDRCLKFVEKYIVKESLRLDERANRKESKASGEYFSFVELKDSCWPDAKVREKIAYINECQASAQNKGKHDRNLIFIKKDLHCENEALEKGFQVIDFSVDKEDMAEMIDSQLQRIANPNYNIMVIERQISYKKTEKQCQVILQEIVESLPNLSVYQSKEINKITSSIARWKQSNQMAIGSIHKKSEVNSQLSRVLTKYKIIFLQLFLICQQIELQHKNKIKQDAINTEMFYRIFMRVIKNYSIYYHRQVMPTTDSLKPGVRDIENIFQYCRVEIIKQLMEVNNGPEFLFFYYFKVYCLSKYPDVKRRDVVNIMNQMPPAAKLKKILNLRGQNSELMELEELLFLNPLLQSESRHILELSAKALSEIKRQSPTRAAEKQRVLEETLIDSIEKSIKLNRVEKLTILKVMFPEKFFELLNSEILRMKEHLEQIELTCVPQKAENYESANQKFIVVKCDVKFWRNYLPMVASTKSVVNRCRSQKNIKFAKSIQKQQPEKGRIKFYELVPDKNKTPVRSHTHTFEQGGAIRVFLTCEQTEMEDSIESYTIEKLLKQFWNELTLDNIYYYNYKVTENKRNLKKFLPSYTEEYLNFQRFERINIVYEDAYLNLGNERKLMDETVLTVSKNKIKSKKTIKFMESEGCHPHSRNKIVSDKSIVRTEKQIKQQFMSRVYLGFKDCQQRNLKHMIYEMEENYIAGLFQQLRNQQPSLTLSALKGILEDMKMKLFETIYENQNCKSQEQQSRKQKIYSLHEELKSIHPVSLSYTPAMNLYLGEFDISSIVAKLVNELSQYCRIKNGKLRRKTKTTNKVNFSKNLIESGKSCKSVGSLWCKQENEMDLEED